MSEELKEQSYDLESIDNFLYRFPIQDTTGISGILSNKAELKRWALDINEPPPKNRGQYFRHQIITQRILRMFDRYFLIHEMGTGKTCSVIGFTEMIADTVNIMTNYKHVYILAGNAIVGEIEYQIACKCSKPGTYDVPSIEKMKTSKAQKSEITKQIHKRYTVVTYHEFITKLLTQLQLEKNLFREGKITDGIIDAMAELVSDSIIWIDEVHNLRVEVGEEEKRDKDYRYNILHKIFHRMVDSKLILSSATPMINIPEELGPILNLILPLNKQIPSDFDWYNAKAKDLEPYVQGRISFVRSMQNDVKVIEAGEYSISKCVSNKIPLKLYPSYMSDFQSNAYQKAKLATLRGDTTLVEERNASLFVYPDGNWGTGRSDEEKEDARRLRMIRKQEKAKLQGKIAVERKRKEENEEEQEEEEQEEGEFTGEKAFKKYIIKTGTDTYQATPEFNKKMNSIEKIRKYSAIFADIIEIETKNAGCGYFYINYLLGGAIPLAMCLEALNWERFYESTSIFEGGTDETSRPYCSEGKTKKKKLKEQFRKPKKRYAMFTGATPDAKFNYMKEAWNSYENRNGDIIKFFIVSRVGKEGISLNNVVRIHNDPSWTWSEIIQSIARALRATSYIYLKDPVVTIYRHVAIDKKGESTGCYMYHKAVDKNYRIARIFRLLKILAADCNLNKTRNVRIEDVPGSVECDYQANCDYNCMYQTPSWIDYSIADNLYIQEVIDVIFPIIKDIFKVKNNYTHEEIIKLIPDKYTRRQIDLTLTYLINNYVLFTDDFGFDNYLREDKGIFFLVRGFPSVNINYHSNYYGKVIIGIETNNNLDAIIEKISEEDINLDNVVLEDLDEYPVNEQVQIFEKAILNNNRDIIDHYKDLYIETEEGDFFHWIYSRDVGTAKYGMSAKLLNADFRKRLLRSGSKIWENPQGSDLMEITEVIKQTMRQKEEKYKEELVVGILEAGIFKIRDNRINPRNKGKAYNSTNIATIYDIMYYLDIPLPEEEMEELKNEDPAEQEAYIEAHASKAIKEMLADADADKIAYVYALLTYKGVRKYSNKEGGLREYLMDELIARDLMIER